MGNLKKDFKVKYEEIRIQKKEPFQFFILKVVGALLDPLNLPKLLVESIRNTRFFLEDKYVEERTKLQHFFDKYVPIDFERLSDSVLGSIRDSVNKILSKTTNQIELDIDKIRQFIGKLYPIRRTVHEHRHVIESLKDL